MSDSNIFSNQVAVKGAVRPAAGPASLADNYLSILNTNNRGEILTAQGLPERAEIVRLGNSWGTMTLTAVAAVTAMPTTAAHCVMHNGETLASGKSYIIDQIFYVVTTASGAAGGASIVACNQRVASAVVVTAAQAVVVGSMSGKGAYGGSASFDDANAVIDHGWFVLKTVAQCSDSTIAVGSSLVAEVNGGIIIAPGGTLGVACLGVNATLAGKFGFVWHEVTIPVNN